MKIRKATDVVADMEATHMTTEKAVDRCWTCGRRCDLFGEETVARMDGKRYCLPCNETLSIKERAKTEAR